MFWVLIYIATNFIAPIPLISLGIDDFFFQFPPKSTNSSRRISQKSANRLKPAQYRLKLAGLQVHAASLDPLLCLQRHRPAPPAPAPGLDPHATQKAHATA
jgi:hypothetical protein